MRPSPKSVTQMLVDSSNGDQAALHELVPVVYDTATMTISSCPPMSSSAEAVQLGLTV